MATKKQQADEAYRRNEAQRMLRVVLDTAARHAGELDEHEQFEEISQIEDAVAIVTAFYLPAPEMRLPDEPGTLPGQLSIDGGIALVNVRELGAPMARAFGAPEHCGSCNAAMLDDAGGKWTPLHHIHPDAPYFLQCGACGAIEEVSRGVYLVVQAERRAMLGKSDEKPPPKERTRRVRGAG